VFQLMGGIAVDEETSTSVDSEKLLVLSPTESKIGRPRKYGSEEERRAAAIERARCWRANNAERARVNKRASEKRVRVREPERARARDRKKNAKRKRSWGAGAVIRAWRWSAQTRAPAQVLAELATDAYAEWFDALDGEETYE
jgi:hypothetical protein